MTPDHDSEEPSRIDKWLWHARFFKTRSLAAAAVNGGKVKLDGERVKAAHRVRIGQLVQVTLDEHSVEVQVLWLPTRRGPAPEARTSYAETPASAGRNARHREQRRLAALARPQPDHRPDKRERRQLEKWRRQQD